MKIFCKYTLLYLFFLCVFCAPNAFGEGCSYEDLMQFKMEGYNLTINKAATIPEGKLKSRPFGPPAYGGVVHS